MDGDSEPLLTPTRAAEHAILAIAAGRDDLLTPGVLDLVRFETSLHMSPESVATWEFCGHTFMQSGAALVLGAAAVVTAPLEAPTLLFGSVAYTLTHGVSALHNAPGEVQRRVRAEAFLEAFGFPHQQLLWSVLPAATLFWYLAPGDTVYELALKAKRGAWGLGEDAPVLGRVLCKLCTLDPGANRLARLERAIYKSARDMSLAANDPSFESAWRVVAALRSGDLPPGGSQPSTATSMPEPPADSTVTSLDQVHLCETNVNDGGTVGERVEGELPSATSVAGTTPAGSNDACSVCLTAPRTHALIPCGHRCLCERCSSLDRLGQTCPICRTHSYDVLRIYDP